MALTRKQSWCRKTSPLSEGAVRAFRWVCAVVCLSDASLSLSSRRCLCITEYGRNVFLLWNIDPAFLWCHLGLHRVDFNLAVWNFDHLISTLHCQSLCQNYKCVDKRLCMPFSLCNFSWSLDFPEWMQEWVKEWVSSTQRPPCARHCAGHCWASEHSWFCWHFLYESNSYHFKWFPVWVMFQNS